VLRNWFRICERHLKPFPIKANAIYPLEQAKAAFVAVAGSSRDRVFCGRPDRSESCPLPASVRARRLVIGLVYCAIACSAASAMMSSLRGWWAEGDGRLVRTYALAIRLSDCPRRSLLAASGVVDLAKSIYLQPAFSGAGDVCRRAAVRYGMVMSNGCGSRALVLLGRGNLRSLVVVIILAIFAQMTLKV